MVPESMKSSLGAGLGKPDLGNTHLPAHLSQRTHSIAYPRKLSLTAALPFPIIRAVPHRGMDQGPLFSCPWFPPMLHTLQRVCLLLWIFQTLLSDRMLLLVYVLDA